MLEWTLVSLEEPKGPGDQRSHPPETERIVERMYIHGTSTAHAMHTCQYITDLLSIKIMIHTNIIEVLCFNSYLWALINFLKFL